MPHGCINPFRGTVVAKCQMTWQREPLPAAAWELKAAAAAGQPQQCWSAGVAAIALLRVVGRPLCTSCQERAPATPMRLLRLLSVAHVGARSQMLAQLQSWHLPLGLIVREHRRAARKVIFGSTSCSIQGSPSKPATRILTYTRRSLAAAAISCPNERLIALGTGPPSTSDKGEISAAAQSPMPFASVAGLCDVRQQAP